MNYGKTKQKINIKITSCYSDLLEQKKTKSYIAKQLNRNRSIITREINNWVKKPTDHYNSDDADFFARQEYLNKRNKDKINTYNPMMSISHEAIYQHICKHRQSYLGKKLIMLLFYHHTKRRHKRRDGKNKIRIKDQVNISQKLKHVELRQEVDHWEGDLIIGLS